MDSQDDSDSWESQEDLEIPDQIDFVTLGMFILDDIDFGPSKDPIRNVLGGAGSYAVLGARLFSPPPLSKTIGWIVDQGSDFPPSVTNLIDTWDTAAIIRYDAGRLTTRGWNAYVGSAEKREFRYSTPKKRITANDLTPELLQSRTFHLICSPTRCQELVGDIKSLRRSIMPEHLYTKPLFIWEPVPDLCTPDQLLNCTNTLSIIDICSPNHSELAGFMGDDGIDPDTGEVSRAAVERSCEQLLASMPLHSYTLVIRAGNQGCYIAKNGGKKKSSSVTTIKKDYTRGGLRPDVDMTALFAGLLCDDDGLVVRDDIIIDPGIERWIPAYHEDEAKVIDPTGGGNAFLGGLSIALARGENVEDAAICGSIAASFAIEQAGMPTLVDGDEITETWNGEVVAERCKAFQARLES